MRFSPSYLEAVLVPAPAGRLPELFKRRRDALRPEAEAGPAEGARRLSPVEVEATLHRIEAQLLTASQEDNERELLALLGQTENHTQWWKRLKIVNDSRELVREIARQSTHWTATLARLEAIAATPLTERQAARDRFFDEVTPLILRPKSRQHEYYALAQKYGDKHAFEALMCRLVVDVPDFYEIEKPFFERFNPQVTGGLDVFRERTGIPRAAYCPLTAAAAPVYPRHLVILSVVLVVGAIALLVWA